MNYCNLWSEWTDLNCRPRVPETRVLNQAELHSDFGQRNWI